MREIYFTLLTVSLLTVDSWNMKQLREEVKQVGTQMSGELL